MMENTKETKQTLTKETKPKACSEKLCCCVRTGEEQGANPCLCPELGKQLMGGRALEHSPPPWDEPPAVPRGVRTKPSSAS